MISHKPVRNKNLPSDYKENFKISGRKVHPEFIKSIVETKKASAIANKDSGALKEEIANAIIKACDLILEGKFVENFIVLTVVNKCS